jgi:hypothetical protein
MSVIKLQKTLPDGRVTEYHKVLEVIFGEVPGIMTVKLGSYSQLEEAAIQTQADGTSYINLPYTGTYEEALTDVIGKVYALPEWSSGELITA